jgi:hypothetical protein
MQGEYKAHIFRSGNVIRTSAANVVIPRVKNCFINKLHTQFFATSVFLLNNIIILYK